MNGKTTYPRAQVIAQWLLLALPSAFMFFLLTTQLNDFFAIAGQGALFPSAWFLAGCAAAVAFYARAFRFVVTTVILGLALHTVYRLAGSFATGEFDGFYVSIKVLIMLSTAFTGWLVGYGFARSPAFVVLWAVLLILVQVLITSRLPEISAALLVRAFIPLLAFAFYIIYAAGLLRNLHARERRPAGFIAARLGGFLLLLALIFTLVFLLFSRQADAIEKQWGNANGKGSKGQDKESMTRRDRDGGVSNKDQTRLTGGLDRDKQLMFVARLDHFFDDGKTPNPLYFTSHYYSKFDTSTQTFETDPSMPYNDLFNPDVSQIPLYFTKADSGVVRRSLGILNRSVVTAEVYKAALSGRTYLAPSTAFYCQPISVPREYMKDFRSAYRAKMWVSDLNSAYFIYNPAGNVMLREFQEMRFNLLRRITAIKGPDDAFMRYYTYMPRDAEYTKIAELARRVTEDARTPIDKVIAIRDYFLGKDELGQPLFRYSDNPGIPGMPSANKLTYFLLENRKGYCAYFAGATLFMLRALGIPSRVAAGFLTTDRSSKNPGWYWFYQDQAHAWVQVYFQGYGWIDFDTTVPDVNTRQAEQPDGTPPTEMPQTMLVADGEILSVDTVARTMHMKVDRMIFRDQDIDESEKGEMIADVSLAVINSDTGEVKLRHVQKGTRATAVSHASVFREMKAEANERIPALLRRIPSPVPIDEVKLMIKKDKDKALADRKQKREPIRWRMIIGTTVSVIGGLALLVILLPAIIWMIFRRRARKGHIYDAHRAALFYMNQLGMTPQGIPPAEFASRVDREFGTDMSTFSALYQKAKYSGVQLSEVETEKARTFYSRFIPAVRSRFTRTQRLRSFLNIFNTYYFFNRKTKQDENHG